MKIKRNTYFVGRVQSLASVEDGVTTMTIGMVLPGTYDFGKAKREEIIQVTLGALWINGATYRAGPGYAPCIIHPGDDITISADSMATYVCRYPNAR